MKMTSLDRILLLLTGLLAAYQVAVGIDGLSTLPIIAYTIAFGVLLGRRASAYSSWDLTCLTARSWSSSRH